MEQQKVFATAWRGFDKRAVLDYIYEQDIFFKKREAELNERLLEYESKFDGQDCAEEAPELYQERMEALERACNEQRETAESLQEKCEKLRHEADQLVQMTRSKEGELQLQTELNRQLQQKCDMLEGKLKTLAEHLLAEREAVIEEVPAPVPAAEEIPMQAEQPFCTKVTDLKGDLSEFKESVSQTLLNFEAALARLEADPPKRYIGDLGTRFDR
ncbi:MAG: hypothetical protein RR209_00550 [Angelakisella sp.]